jgi:hypothetical protein
MHSIRSTFCQKCVKKTELVLDIMLDCMQAANYLNIKSLLDLGCLTVANMIKGKSQHHHLPPQPWDLHRISSLQERFCTSSVVGIAPCAKWQSLACWPAGLVLRQAGLTDRIDYGFVLVVQERRRRKSARHSTSR